MGYYNDIAIATTAETEEKMNQLIASTEGEHLWNEANVSRHGNEIVRTWETVKWNDMREDVGIIENALNELWNNDEPVLFLRVGEELGDVDDTRAYHPEMTTMLGVHQTITTMTLQQ